MILNGSDNKYTMCQNVWMTAKAELGEIYMCVYVRVCVMNFHG